MYAGTHVRTSRERERERDSVESQTTWSTPAPSFTLSSSRPFRSRRRFSTARPGFSLFLPLVRPTFHASLTKAHATIYSHFAPQPRGDFSSFCHNFSIIKIYGHPCAYPPRRTIRLRCTYPFDQPVYALSEYPLICFPCSTFKEATSGFRRGTSTVAGA